MDSGFMQKNRVLSGRGMSRQGEEDKCLIMKQKYAIHEDPTGAYILEDYSC